jgi:hypothetical protein
MSADFPQSLRIIQRKSQIKIEPINEIMSGRNPSDNGNSPKLKAIKDKIG